MLGEIALAVRERRALVAGGHQQDDDDREQARLGERPALTAVAHGPQQGGDHRRGRDRQTEPLVSRVGISPVPP